MARFEPKFSENMETWSVADPGSGAFLTPGSGMGKKPRSESLETIFSIEILKFFDADANQDPGPGNLFDPGSGIQDGKNSDPG